MSGVEQTIIERFQQDGKVAVWLGQDDVSNILSYLFFNSSSVYVSGRYTIFKRA